MLPVIEYALCLVFPELDTLNLGVDLFKNDIHCLI